MKRIVAAMTFAIVAHAQSGAVSRGAEIFRTTCSVPYCHGAAGSAGRAPQLAGTALPTRDLVRVIGSGTQAGMPAFGQKLSLDDMDAVAQYIRSLPAPAKPAAAAAPPVAGPPAARALAPAAEKGRALFFDATRMGGCGSCHELDNRGSAVGPDLRTAAPVHDLRAGSSSRVVTATPAGEESFPAILADRTPQRVRVYDLSSPLPVLRTFPPDRVSLTTGAAWSHASAVRNYSDGDLEIVTAYLAALGPDK